DSARVELFDAITHAWSEQRCVKIWYRSSRGENKLRTYEVSTYFIEPRLDGAVYVVGFDSVSQRVRAFKLNRIQQAEILASTYQMPFHFDTKRYLLYLRESAKIQHGQDGVQR
ncbi:MAG TPA: WYL domain-containing protein, partial [Phototrophicaceae bacterium]|nr:WYL domain-containing protein [Phototrophicaceae bacterium]